MRQICERRSYLRSTLHPFDDYEEEAVGILRRNPPFLHRFTQYHTSLLLHYHESSKERKCVFCFMCVLKKIMKESEGILESQRLTSIHVTDDSIYKHVSSIYPSVPSMWNSLRRGRHRFSSPVLSASFSYNLLDESGQHHQILCNTFCVVSGEGSDY